MKAIFFKTRTGFSAHVPALPKCIATGATLEETRQLVREAIEMHLEGLREDGIVIAQLKADG
jgi:predicted RNase H-like HicB family nuclease